MPPDKTLSRIFKIKTEHKGITCILDTLKFLLSAVRVIHWWQGRTPSQNCSHPLIPPYKWACSNSKMGRLLLSCAKSHVLSASRRQPHLLHISTVDGTEAVHRINNKVLPQTDRASAFMVDHVKTSSHLVSPPCKTWSLFLILCACM